MKGVRSVSGIRKVMETRMANPDRWGPGKEDASRLDAVIRAIYDLIDVVESLVKKLED